MTTNQVLKLADLNFTNRLHQACPFIYARVLPQPISAPKILHVNVELLNRLEIDPQEVEKPSFLRFLNGDLDFEGLFFGSSFYCGHQFGHLVPKLGDGRALTLGEIKNSSDQFFELQLKGAGLTPFSRMGDGRAVVRSSIREHLASLHLKALGIPTTESLAIIHGSDDVYREDVEKSAIVLRVAESFLRFGHFEYFYYSKKMDELKLLLDFTIKNYFSKYEDHPNKYVLFYQEVIKSTAKLFAHWQAQGFCHGVLNTDNMSILGLTLDYGPYGFIDHFNLDHICNHSDYEGRYSFGNQPSIGLWNLKKLGEVLSSFIDPDDLERTLGSYSQLFHFEYRRLIKEKLGLVKNESDDEDFFRLTLNMLATTKIDYTIFFRNLSHYQTNKNWPDEMPTPLIEFFKLYEERLTREETSSEERKSFMLAKNPKYILRNYIAQIALENYILDEKIFSQIANVLTHPFEEWPECVEWSKPAPIHYKNLSVSCSS